MKFVLVLLVLAAVSYVPYYIGKQVAEKEVTENHQEMDRLLKMFQQDVTFSYVPDNIRKEAANLTADFRKYKETHKV